MYRCELQSATPTYVNNATAASNTYCARLAEKGKHDKYDQVAKDLHTAVSLIAAAFTTYGGWGDEYYSTFVVPYYKEDNKQDRPRQRIVRLGCLQRQAPL